MFRILLLSLCVALCCGRHDHEDWTDPTDMFNYDAATGKMIKQKHNTEEKVDGVCEKAGEESCPGSSAVMVRDVEKPKQVTEEHKDKEVLKLPEGYSNPVLRRFLRKVLKEAERFGLPEDSSSEVYYNAEMVLTKQMVAEIQKFIDDKDWNLGALEEALIRTLVQFRYHNVKEWWTGMFEDYIGIDLGTTFKILLCITCIVTVIATELWSCVGWFTQLKRLCILSFFISVAWNWMYLYKVAFAERQAELAKNQKFDDNCGEKISWSESLIDWWRGVATFRNDPCEEYFKALMINPVLMVPPTKALALTFTDFVTEPLKHVGKAMGEFLNGFLAEIPALYQLLVLILLMAIILVSCYGASTSVGQVLALRSNREPQRERLPPAEPPREKLLPAEPTRERLPPPETAWERLPPAEPRRPHYGNVIEAWQPQPYYIEPPYRPVYTYPPNQRPENLQAIDVPYWRPPGPTEMDFGLRHQDGGGERRKEDVTKEREQSGKPAEPTEESSERKRRKEESKERPDGTPQGEKEPIVESSFSKVQKKEDPPEPKSTAYQRKVESIEEVNNSKTESVHSKEKIEEEPVDQKGGEHQRVEEPPHERSSGPQQRNEASVEEISYGEQSLEEGGAPDDKSLEQTGRNEEVTNQKPSREESGEPAKPTEETSDRKQRKEESKERPDGTPQGEKEPIVESSFTEVQNKEDPPEPKSTEYQRKAESIEEVNISAQQSNTESLQCKEQIEEKPERQSVEEPPHERSSGPQQRNEASVEEISYGEQSLEEGGAPDDKSLEQTGRNEEVTKQKPSREQSGEPAKPTEETSDKNQRKEESKERPDGTPQGEKEPIVESFFTEVQKKEDAAEPKSTEYQGKAESIEEISNSSQESNTEIEEEPVDQNGGERQRVEEPPHERSSGPQQRNEISYGEQSLEEGGAPDDKSLEQTGASNRNPSARKINREEATKGNSLLEEIDEYEYEYEDEYEYSYPSEEEEEESSDESEEETVIEREESAAGRALMERLRKKAEEAGYTQQQCFQDDPEWPSLEDVPKESNYVHPRIGNTSWCGCHNCKPMKTRDESNCCVEESALKKYFDQGLSCILEQKDLKEMRFQKKYLEIMAEFSGKVSLKEWLNDRNRVIRKAAYRSYSCFVHGSSGPSKRKPIPSCVISYIRGVFPDPEGHNVGPHEPRDYSAADMADDV
ncbi:chloride channel CLIC-like protein 1 isoform X2 [Hyla sarda]|uniref:chloride channel CLIC-like protein 1 isoform X2 n=1 Tax=Hyla sarda TaxID=327740 RepID=UPI0024C29ABE|nr:chloride channel CLIC-like protein 1 isoform X2 [Hyla sarda]